MAKSKEVKQQEALERKRAQYGEKLRRVTDQRVGGKIYDDRLDRWGLDKTKELEDQANKDFGLYLREARLDSHGNPFVYGLKTVYSENDSVFKGFMATTIIRDMASKRRTQTGGEGLHDFLAQPDVESFN